MAYTGLARPVIAPYLFQNGRLEYSEGVRFGKAVKIEISPNYEDVSDYEDINETEEKQEFVYADVTLGTDSIPYEAEKIVFGHAASENEVRSNSNDRAGPVGLGIRTREVISGQIRYVAIWLHKVTFTEEGEDHETKGDSIAYVTPSINGKAVPDENGDWRTKRIFLTRQDADAWLDEMAGIQQEER